MAIKLRKVGMKTLKPTNAKGFTIIEVVLVLAIAGLIFLVVFLALPALQRSQRDTQRRSDASRVVSQIAAYQSNSQGSVPTSDAQLQTFKSGYMTNGGQQFKDPSTGNDYNLSYRGTNYAAPTADGDMYYYTTATCSGGAASAGTGNRNVAIVVKVEQGGTYCVNN